MFVFQWNSMRIGDHVMVHDDDDAGLALRPGIVKYVETREQGQNDVTIQLDDHASRPIRPRRHAVHMLPVDRRFSCWRCDVIAAESSEPANSSEMANKSDVANNSDVEGQRAAA
jgi:hypothetical protein